MGLRFGLEIDLAHAVHMIESDVFPLIPNLLSIHRRSQARDQANPRKSQQVPNRRMEGACKTLLPDSLRSGFLEESKRIGKGLSSSINPLQFAS